MKMYHLNPFFIKIVNGDSYLETYILSSDSMYDYEYAHYEIGKPPTNARTALMMNCFYEHEDEITKFYAVVNGL